MQRVDYHNQITLRFNILKALINSSSQLNLYDVHIHCENFYLHLLKLIFDWKLENLNVYNRNSPGIDLIDLENKIMIQVSATCTKEKIDASLNKIDRTKYKGFRFKFISISENAEKLKKKSYVIGDDIFFDQMNDILDVDTLLKHINVCDIDKVEAIHDLILKEINLNSNIYNNQLGVDYNKCEKIKFPAAWFRQKVIENVKNIGERYSDKLDVDFNLSKVIDAIEQNRYFLDEFKNEFEKLRSSFSYISHSNELSDENYVRVYFEHTNRLINDASNNKVSILKISNILSECRSLSLDLKIKIEQDRYLTSKYGFKSFNEQLGKYISYLDSDNVRASINPFILISGNAGVGKSHFIAHNALKRANEDKISLLILGQLFHDNTHPFLQMKKQLGLNDSFEMDEVFRCMNILGEERNERAIIFIDALNEGNGLNIWPDYLSGIVDNLKQYSHISVILSVRDTYSEQVLPTKFSEENNFIGIKFEGFSDVDEAVQKFFAYYKVPYSINENLRPQFSNPLFLKMYCSGYSENNSIQYGLDAILLNYFSKLNKDIRKRYAPMIFPQKINIVELAIDAYVDIRIEKKNHDILYNEFSKRLISKFEGFSIPFNILDELIAEGVFSCVNYSAEIYVYLAYELFDNYLIAKRIVKYCLDRNKDCESLANYIFSENNKYFELLKNDDGILEAIAIILPDLDIAVDSDRCEMFFWPQSNLNMDSSIYYTSMLWRRPERIKYIAHSYVMNNCFVYIDLRESVLNDFFDTVLQLTLVKNHIYNSNFLYKFLNVLSLDFFNRHWTSYVSYRFHQNRVFKTLVKWAWNCGTNGIKDDNSTFESLAKTLVWFLASLNHEVRDVTIKALMRLYSNNLVILIKHLEKFRNVKDMYILEGLLAATYGAILNRKDVDCLSEVGEVLYPYFKKENIMVRSYLQNIYLYLAFRNVQSEKVDFNTFLFKPRNYYQVNELQIDKIREGILTKDDYTKMERCYINYEDYTEELTYEHNRIIRSFERYIKDIENEKSEIEDLHVEKLIDQIPVEDRENFIWMVVKEIFDMGFNYLMFMDKDLYGDYSSNHLDSIVLKYEWIAINKILDIYLSDKGEILEAFKGNKIQFEGVWQIPFFRWIDPTMDFFSCFETKVINEVVYKIEDILYNFESILRCENFDENWIKFNKIRYFTSNNKVENAIGIMMNNAEITSTITILSEHRCIPPQKSFEDLYVRELYWSKAYNYIQDECKQFNKLSEGAEYISENYIWDISDGSMVEYFSFSAASKYVFDELELEMKGDVFSLYNKNQIVVKSLFEETYEDVLLVKESHLSNYLISNNKSILWPFFETENNLKCILYDGEFFRII